MTEKTLKKPRKPGAAAVRPAKPRAVPSNDPTIKCYKALTKLLVADGDGVGAHDRVFGDYVPEAESWKNIGMYLRQQLLEPVYINKSELDRWLTEYAERVAAQDAEKFAAQTIAEEIAELDARRAELLAKQGKTQAPAAKPTEEFDPSGEKTIVEKIDLGGVKSKHTGMPRPAALPTVRNTSNLPNVGENRKAPTKVLRKKG